ncbi:MAG TPA: response regulator transcription factor [Patescibacteria group bacterium]|jgi:two-component system response regulator NreC|nr:response regulator transcription factor [Patescibacteria group bacterium]
MTIIRVLLAEDHTLVRKGLRSLLNDVNHILVIDEAENGHEAVKKTRLLQPDIVLMDISMPLLNGLEATRQIKHELPETGIIILTMHANAEYIFQGLQAGAESYLVKQSAPEELVNAIETTYRGESYLSPLISKTVIEEYIRHAGSSMEHGRYETLTRREREVLQLIAEGYSIHDIGHHLVISEKTARVHRKNLMQKLDLHTIADLTLYALRKGVIALED